MHLYACSVYDHIEFSTVPIACPVCKSPAADFKRCNSVFDMAGPKPGDGAEMHVPVVSVHDTCGLISQQPCVDIVSKIGAVPHPMKAGHFIQFIDCYVDHKYLSRINLRPGVYAAGCFHLKSAGVKVTVVGHCSLHGYRKAEAFL